MEHVLIIGATSAIAEATARRYAARGAALALAARNADRLAMLARDVELRGAARVVALPLALDATGGLVAAAERALDGLDVVLVCHGLLPDQARCERDLGALEEAFAVNLISVCALLHDGAALLAARGRGTLAALGSVAGDRGRQSNYVYGAAKGGLEVFLAGLRNRLARVGVHVLTIKPGFVDTPMTAGFAKGALWVSPDTVAEGIVRAIDRRRDVVYLPWFWRWIMRIIRLIPEPLFKRLSL